LLTILRSFLDESKNTGLIRWSDRGDSIVVLDEDELAQTVIPLLFRHSNYASFVRQLNMYGFHKRVGLADNTMKASQRKNSSPSEYYNPYFKQGHPNLLWLINRTKARTNNLQKKGVKNEQGHADMDSDHNGKDVEEIFYGNNQGNYAPSTALKSGQLQRRDVALIQAQLADVQKQYGAVSQAFARLRKEHRQLYQQAVAFQTWHNRHESSLSAILTFPANVCNSSMARSRRTFPRGFPTQSRRISSATTKAMSSISERLETRRSSTLAAPAPDVDSTVT
jgi:heat shock transcription factor